MLPYSRSRSICAGSSPSSAAARPGPTLGAVEDDAEAPRLDVAIGGRSASANPHSRVRNSSCCCGPRQPFASSKRDESVDQRLARHDLHRGIKRGAHREAAL